MFQPESEVKALTLQIKGMEEPLPLLNVLIWQEEGQQFAHCLELDICGYGKTPHEALRSLAELIDAQIAFAKTHHTELLHPAPADYWQKLYEIHTNRVQQVLLSNPDQFTRAVLHELQRADV